MRQALSFSKFARLSNISNSQMLVCFLRRNDINKTFFTPDRIDRVRTDTCMGTGDAYEILGDAVYDVLFYSYVWRRNMDLDLYLLGRSKSNISMSCIVKDSPIYDYVRKLSTNRQAKASADIFEALIGMVFDHLVSDRYEISEYMETWMTDVFDIGGVFDRLLIDRQTPNHSYILPSEKVDTLYLYKLAVQKLAIIYYLFNIYKCGDGASMTIHNIYDPYRDSLLPSIEEDISSILDSDDILKDVAHISNNFFMT